MPDVYFLQFFATFFLLLKSTLLHSLQRPLRFTWNLLSLKKERWEKGERNCYRLVTFSFKWKFLQQGKKEENVTSHGGAVVTSYFYGKETSLLISVVSALCNIYFLFIYLFNFWYGYCGGGMCNTEGLSCLKMS